MYHSLFLRALQKNKLETPPIWLMRQAGRYLPEYQLIRRRFKDFLDMCKHPEICAELVMQPIQRYDLDAAILFSDILTIPDAFDLGLKFYEGKVQYLKDQLIQSMTYRLYVNLMKVSSVMSIERLRLQKRILAQLFL